MIKLIDYSNGKSAKRNKNSEQFNEAVQRMAAKGDYFEDKSNSMIVILKRNKEKIYFEMDKQAYCWLEILHRHYFPEDTPDNFKFIHHNEFLRSVDTPLQWLILKNKYITEEALNKIITISKLIHTLIENNSYSGMCVYRL